MFFRYYQKNQQQTTMADGQQQKRPSKKDAKKAANAAKYGGQTITNTAKHSTPNPRCDICSLKGKPGRTKKNSSGQYICTDCGFAVMTDAERKARATKNKNGGVITS